MVKCPGCGYARPDRDDEEINEDMARREYSCPECRTTWRIYGTPVLEVVSVDWIKVAEDIQYGPGVDVEALEAARIMEIAKKRTIPMFLKSG